MVIRWCLNSVRLDFNVMKLDEITKGMSVHRKEVLSLEVWGQKEKPSKTTERGAWGVGLWGCKPE